MLFLCSSILAVFLYFTMTHLKCLLSVIMSSCHNATCTLILVDLTVVSVWFGVVAVGRPRTVAQQFTISGWKCCIQCPVFSRRTVTAVCWHVCCRFCKWSRCHSIPVKTRWKYQQTAGIDCKLAYDRLFQNDIWSWVPRVPVAFYKLQTSLLDDVSTCLLLSGEICDVIVFTVMKVNLRCLRCSFVIMLYSYLISCHTVTFWNLLICFNEHFPGEPKLASLLSVFFLHWFCYLWGRRPFSWATTNSVRALMATQSTDWYMTSCLALISGICYHI